MDISVSTTMADRQRGGCAIVGIHEGRRLGASAKQIDATSGGALSKLVRASALRGRAGQTLLVNAVEGASSDQVLLVGLGARGKLDESGARRALRTAFETIGKAGVRQATVYLEDIEMSTRDSSWLPRESALAALESTYRYAAPRRSKGHDDAPSLKRLTIAVDGRAAVAPARVAEREARAIASGLALARDLGNTPPNVCTPSHLADQARKIARTHDGVSVSVRGEPEMKRMRMGALVGVAQGSREPARLITLEYAGGAKGERPIVLIGKGVTFDSGGISLKPGAAMDEMKFDMCGAASVLGTVAAAAEMGLARNVIGIVPATENLPDGAALKPGDVVTSMSGRTVEILNTDAEGRLLLCDALTYAARFHPEAVIDIATLTGACVIALGSQASGLFANDDALADALLAAGESSGDRAWRMPLWKEYTEQLRSNFADLANIGGREAGAVTAACFLAEFAEDQRWAHLDIAGTAWRGGREKGSTGRPVRLLCQYLLDAAPRRRARAAGRR